MSDEESDVATYVMPGSENTNFFGIEDTSGDAEAAEDDKRISVYVLVAIVFALGVVVAVGLFYAIHVAEKRKKERQEAAKLAGASRNSFSSSQANPQSNSASTNNNTSASAAAANPEVRQKEINDGLIVQTWMAEVHPSESKEDEESGSDSNKDTCPICRKNFEAGDEVCSSRNQSCGHSFHKTCMSNWLQYQTRCPVCNQEYLTYSTILS